MRYNKHNLNVATVAAKEGKIEFTHVHITPEKTFASDSFRYVEVTTPKTEGALDAIVKPIELENSLMVHRNVVKSIKLPKLDRQVAGSDAVYITAQDKEDVVFTTFDMETASKKNTEAKAGPENQQMFEDFVAENVNQKGVTFKVNVDLLIEVLKIAKGMTWNVEVTVPTKAGKPIIIKGEGGEKQKMLGLVMPLNS